MGEIGNACRILMEKLRGKHPPTRLRRRWEDDIKMDLRETNCEDGRWM
jgi:hypothetical protein